MAVQTVDVKSLVDRHQQPKSTTAIESQLASILDTALNSSSSSSAAPVPDSAAGDIDGLYASGYASDDKAESLFWTLWTFYLEVAKKVPADDDTRQRFLVDVVDKLRSRQRGTVKVWSSHVNVWGDLSMLAPCMREAWNFNLKFDDSEQDNAAIKSWISLNSFAARLLGAYITSWDNFPIWALRDGLENEPRNDIARDCHLTVAYEWVTHAGKVLYEKGRKPEDLDEAGKRALKPGKLFEGESGLSDKRWQFWRQRLEELARKTGSEELKAKAQKAVEKMKSVEG